MNAKGQRGDGEEIREKTNQEKKEKEERSDVREAISEVAEQGAKIDRWVKDDRRAMRTMATVQCGRSKRTR